MTSLDRDSFAVSALGHQSQSQRETISTHKISTVGRHHYDGVYISEEHTRTSKIGRESPPGGPIYNSQSSLGGVRYGFGTAKRGSLALPRAEGKDDVPTNDALGASPDSQIVKYRREPHPVMGTESRGKLKGAELLKNHPAAFYARESPGPAAVGGEYGPKFTATKPKLAPARPFGGRTYHKGTDWMRYGDNPDEVGPGRHERKDVSIGQQHLSRRRNQPVNEFSHAPKFAKDKADTAVSKLDAAKSSLGRQTLAKNRSEPSINFSADNRATRSKTMLCMTRQDMGPTASMPKFIAPQPPLPVERHIMKSGFG